MLYVPKIADVSGQCKLSSSDYRIAMLFRQRLRHVCEAGRFKWSVLTLSSA